MMKKTEKILEIWHKHFADEEKQYSEFESSDIEYFVGCMLYNHFNFSTALDTMKTIDLSYDFLASCDEEYDEIMAIVKSIEFDDEKDRIEFLQNFIAQAQKKYTNDELYLLNRLGNHVAGVAQRYISGEEAKKVDFVAPTKTFVNPLLR
ncbi:hypothetical protein SMGD1_2461 [Sulfurimonas gotlandica GD1]|jgi:uncharacterized protein (DUF2235 family)|uniref:Uncharacterized protein n=1 Tax=Sulfurimonas gotlandica (strain DSM 19862 / JCM 16533 / GD1) TaxID=929558 RepID=B6BNB4_SULGG|nr:hypothetical protein [Sulfurimonas gotlandica]EDZ61452.1 hypothetical protein CBGD1_2520 [Sulfurimonas gotlandica GD1]EHP30984.1 hypothetical protein SMGD1_2461 [Sulfurimonas gotlandica GD1]